MVFSLILGCATVVQNSTPGRESRQDVESAVGSVVGAVSGKGTAVKYCPVTGKRFAPKFKACPVHGVELKEVGE